MYLSSGKSIYGKRGVGAVRCGLRGAVARVGRPPPCVLPVGEPG